VNAGTAVEQLAAAALAIAESHPPRSAHRRAASHLWVAATVPPAKSIAAVRRAVLSFGDGSTQRDALELLGQLLDAVEQSTTGELSA
jgi:hypothetical protein